MASIESKSRRSRQGVWGALVTAYEPFRLWADRQRGVVSLIALVLNASTHLSGCKPPATPAAPPPAPPVQISLNIYVHARNMPGMPVDTAAIRSRREKLELTLEEAARRAGMTAQRWHDIEAGRYADIRLSTLEAVAKALGCGVDQLRSNR
jgi:DNA-binding Xre family transcriptional regulator